MSRGIALIVAMLVLAGCGSSSGSNTSAAVSSAQTAETAVVKPISRSAARAFVRAVRLRPSDMPGFKATTESEHKTEAEKKQGHTFMRCVGAVAYQEGFAKGNSKNLEPETSSSTESVESFVEVARSRRAAAEQFATARSAHVRACLSKFVTKLFTTAGHGVGTVTPVSVAPYSPEAQGTNGTFGWRFSTTLSTHGLRFPVQFDVSGFRYGTAIVALVAIGFPHPFAAAEEQRLFSLLVGRAQSFDRDPN